MQLNKERQNQDIVNINCLEFFERSSYRKDGKIKPYKIYKILDIKSESTKSYNSIK